MRREKTNYIIQSVSHALDVLEQFSGDADELGVTELSQAAEAAQEQRLSPARDARVARLHRAEQGAPRTTGSASAACSSVRATSSHMGLLRQARPIMETLVRQARETAYVAVLRRGGVVPLDGRRGRSPGAHRLAGRRGAAAALHRGRQGAARLRVRGRSARRAHRTACRSSPSARSPTARRSSSSSRRSPRTATRSTSASTSRTCARSPCRSATTRATWSARSPSSGPRTA